MLCSKTASHTVAKSTQLERKFTIEAQKNLAALGWRKIVSGHYHRLDDQMRLILTPSKNLNALILHDLKNRPISQEEPKYHA